MPAVAPAEQHTPELHGSSNRHPPPRLVAWPARLRAPPQAAAPSGASRQACHAGGRAGRGTQPRAVREFPRLPPPRLAAWHARLRAPPQPAAAKWSKPPGLPCRRSRRQSHTIPSCAGVPTPSAAKTGGVARRTARSTSSCRPKWSKPPGLPCRRSRRRRNTIPSGAGVPTPSAAKTGGVARKTARSTSSRCPSGACRQACHAGGHAGRVTQSRVAREFQRHPPPRLAPWHARLRAPPQVARLLIGRYAGIRSGARLLRSARQ